MDLENDFFLMQFVEEVDYTYTLSGGPWTMLCSHGMDSLFQGFHEENIEGHCMGANSTSPSTLLSSKNLEDPNWDNSQNFPVIRP